MAIKGTIKEATLFSNALGEEITLLIYLPPSFSPLYKYHLLIAQDGKDYFQFGRIGRVADELLANHQIAETIIVGIPYSSVQDRREKYHPDGPQNKAYIRFLAHELIPYLDEQFPTYQMGLGRGLIGDSLGATVSLMTALKYPHTFGKIILQSPLVNEEVLERIRQFDSYHLLEIDHIIGTGETAVQTTIQTTEDFLTPNRELAQLLKSTNSEYTYEEFNGNHTWKHWQPYIAKMLVRMFPS
ncbi:alpha/beta hydrolase [Niallia sp. FSL W8-0635]|uniref:alpha/beta hydrolase n=1 Tax=Niallia sp. FSL W8-0635 TaxID=2975337 RepID=UPI0030FAE9F9